MRTKELINWFGGPVAHLHLRSERDPGFFSETERHQFTQEAALHYLTLLYGSPASRLTDTNHALISMDVDNLKRPDQISLAEWRKEIVTSASKSTLGRLKEIGSDPELQKVILGVEADIIDADGSLSLNNECLRKLDFTIASFHWFIWKIFSEKKDITPNELMSAYLNVVDNPNVMVLGHPLRISSKLTGEVTPADFDAVLRRMAKKRIAFEINLFDVLADEKAVFSRQVIRRIAALEVPILFGLDFHHLEELALADDLDVYNGVVNRSNVMEVFKDNSDLHFRMFRLLLNNIKILKGLGVKESQIVNSSEEVFNEWLRGRVNLG